MSSHVFEETVRDTKEAAVEEEPELPRHPEPRQYVVVAIALAIVTALEVAVFYVDVPRVLFVTLLLVMSAVKFSLVVLWFMHLRFDSRIFRRLFISGIILAVFVYAVVLAIFLL
ncbi:MAG TPA: cytochrome C oxidase subunit IV family protein [Actinomycetota bacterium]|nr:cytochrome C oxidase subunit IV family protein [Actinomycetota bacterium]